MEQVLISNKNKISIHGSVNVITKRLTDFTVTSTLGKKGPFKTMKEADIAWRVFNAQKMLNEKKIMDADKAKRDKEKLARINERA